MVGLLVDLLVGWLVSWVFGLLTVCWLVGFLFVWLVCRMDGWLADLDKRNNPGIFSYFLEHCEIG